MIDPTRFFKCLADATRLKCLLLIEQEQELCVCELTAALADSQPKISRHLAQLRSCGVVADRRQGQWVFYRINPALPDWARAVIRAATTDNAAFLEQERTRLEQMGERPQRLSACC